MNIQGVPPFPLHLPASLAGAISQLSAQSFLLLPIRAIVLYWTTLPQVAIDTTIGNRIEITIALPGTKVMCTFWFVPCAWLNMKWLMTLVTYYFNPFDFFQSVYLMGAFLAKPKVPPVTQGVIGWFTARCTDSWSGLSGLASAIQTSCASTVPYDYAAIWAMLWLLRIFNTFIRSSIYGTFWGTVSSTSFYFPFFTIKLHFTKLTCQSNHRILKTKDLVRLLVAKCHPRNRQYLRGLNDDTRYRVFRNLFYRVGDIFHYNTFVLGTQ